MINIKHNKKINREEDLPEIFNEIIKLSKKDMRIGQIFECLKMKSNTSDLFNIENDEFLKLLKELNPEK